MSDSVDKLQFFLHVFLSWDSCWHVRSFKNRVSTPSSQTGKIFPVFGKLRRQSVVYFPSSQIRRNGSVALRWGSCANAMATTETRFLRTKRATDISRMHLLFWTTLLTTINNHRNCKFDQWNFFCHFGREWVRQRCTVYNININTLITPWNQTFCITSVQTFHVKPNKCTKKRNEKKIEMLLHGFCFLHNAPIPKADKWKMHSLRCLSDVFMSTDFFHSKNAAKSVE